MIAVILAFASFILGGIWAARLMEGFSMMGFVGFLVCLVCFVVTLRILFRDLR